MADSRADGKEFYVGYLPVPSGYRRALLILVPALIVAGLVAAVVVAARQKDPGTGVWSDATTTLEGVIAAEPYAMLRLRASNAAGVETVLLVEEGKFGAKERVRPFDGQAVAVTGTILARDGRRMLELAGGEQAIRPVEGGVAPGVPEKRLLGRRTLRGEIIDPKCYLGAMKPGEGKTHKACATLCISGGIPPMFVVRSPGQPNEYYLLTTPDGRAINNDVLPFVGDPVEIAGEVMRQGDLLVFQISSADIRRL
jgi:hypothetical protein